MDNIKIEILPNGRIKFRRGDKRYNKKVKKFISKIIDNNDDNLIKDLDIFFKGSEETEIIIGDSTFCG